MGKVLLGVGIYVLGFIISVVSAGYFAGDNVEYSFYYGIVFSVLYLAGVVGVCTSLILKEMRNKK